MVSTPEQQPSGPAVTGASRPTLAFMRAMAHPARRTIIDRLNLSGPATATELAGQVDLSPSATSYHLRALAKAGLIEEATGRGDGRERAWRSVSRAYQVDWDPDAPPAVREAERGMIDALLIQDEGRVRQYIAGLDQEPPEWYNAGFFAQSMLVLTAAELTALAQKILALVEPYNRQTRTDPPPGSRMVTMQLRGFPLEPPMRD